MNLSTLIGLAIGVVTLIVAVTFSGTAPGLFINIPGLVVVLGGTCAALFISVPLRDLKRVFALVRTVFRDDRIDSERDIEELVTMTKLWMNNDVRTVEQALKKVSNPFLRTGVQLIIDHTREDQIIELLQWRIARLRARERAEAHMFRLMAAYAPAFGMLGSLVGLINLMSILDAGSLDAIGRQLAVGLMTTFYGILLGNLICKPIAVKLERRTEHRIERMNMVMQGISMMCNKRGPAVMRATLNSFMMHVEDEMHDGGVADKDGGAVPNAAGGKSAVAMNGAGASGAVHP
jgi:chemotaxis protein MotA